MEPLKMILGGFLMIQEIKPEDTYPLRHQILRPNQSIQECSYPLDHEPDSYHVGYYQNGQIIGIGSVHRESLPQQNDPNTWRIRGMAVLDIVRGQGIGGHILTELIQYAASQSTPGTIWCNGRLPASNFYRRHGFQTDGQVFELPKIGPHLLFTRSLTESDLKR